MRFPTYFKRGKNTPAAGPVLGSDTAPSVSTGHGDSNKDNVLQAKIGGIGNSISRLAIGFWYEGLGVATVLPVTAWIWDASSEKWFKASAGSLTNGETTYLKLPVLADPPQTQANITKPGAGGVEVLIIVSDNAIGDGTLHFVAGPDVAQG